MVLSDDYGTGYAPWGKFHYVAVISWQCSLGAYRKITAGQQFSADARGFSVGKVLRGKEYGKTIGMKEVSTEWVALCCRATCPNRRTSVINSGSDALKLTNCPVMDITVFSCL